MAMYRTEQDPKKGTIETEAKAPSSSPDLMSALSALSSRSASGIPRMSGRELQQRLEMLRREKRKTAFSGDFRDPNLLFNQQNEDYKGLNNVSERGKAKAEAFYQKMIDDLQAQAYAIKESVAKPPNYQSGDFGKILAQELNKGKSLEQIQRQMD
tara:strand:- start:309 stop:773 length:465 start_codon:yes stop_codon:yes gene_type:complete